jgi:hypothetical protein
MRAVPVLELRVNHPFYDDRRCRDFAIAPTGAADVLMRRLRLICKPFADHVSLFAEVNAQGVPFAAAAAPLALDFFLRPRGAGFAMFTDLAPIAAQNAPLFTNAELPAADPLSLRLTSRAERGIETLTVRTGAAAESFVLAGRPQPGTAAAALRVETLGFAGSVQSLDLVANRVTVDTSAAKPGVRFDLSYPVSPTRPHDVFAEVELLLDDAVLGSPAAGPRTFLVPLAANAARWCFYVVTDYTGDISALRIVDTTPGGASNGIAFAAGGCIDLTQNPDLGDAVGQDLARRNSGRRILRLVSDAPVACRETPQRNLELHLGETRLGGALANPAPRNFAALANANTPSAAPETVLYNVLMLIAN